MFENYPVSSEGEQEKPRTLSPHEREEAVRWLDAGLAGIAGGINARAGFAFADDECRVSMDAYAGLYDKRMRKDDRRLVMTHRLYSSGVADTALYREAHAEGNAMPSENAEVARLLAERERDARRSDGQLAEAVATIVLHRAIGDRFLVTRASAYDDYENGVDTLVIDKETGETVCAFDEVVDASYPDLDGSGAERYRKKIARSKESLRKHGGMRVKYGATYAADADGPRLELRALDHVPTFCLSLDRTELYGLVRGMTREGDGLGPAETAFLVGLLEKLESQERDFRTSGFGGEADRLGRFRATLGGRVSDR